MGPQVSPRHPLGQPTEASHPPGWTFGCAESCRLNQECSTGSRGFLPGVSSYELGPRGSKGKNLGIKDGILTASSPWLTPAAVSGTVQGPLTRFTAGPNALWPLSDPSRNTVGRSAVAGGRLTDRTPETEGGQNGCFFSITNLGWQTCN